MAGKCANGTVPLIFYVPVADDEAHRQYGISLQDVCNSAGKGTIIAFSAVCGTPIHDHLPAHPFWNQLRLSRQKVTTPLMPIINAGGVNQGEGLWPSLPFDLFHYFQCSCRHHFAGVAVIANHLPASGGFLDCSLWVAAQLQWRDAPPENLIETWFKAHRPDIDYPLEKDFFKQMRDIAKELSYLRFLKGRKKYTVEELRLLIESLLARLKVIKLKAAKDRPMSLIDQVNLFLIDARWILLNFASSCDVPLLPSAGEEDLQESFWTKAAQAHSSRNGLKTLMLEIPEKGTPQMQRIYHGNFIEIS